MGASTQGAQAISEPARWEGTPVLIVSSDRKFLFDYRVKIAQFGLLPITASTLEGALGCLRIMTLAFIIVDEGGLDSKGRELLERARRMQAQASVIVIGHNANPELRSQALGLGAADYLVDPTDLDRLQGALINSFLKGRRKDQPSAGPHPRG